MVAASTFAGTIAVRNEPVHEGGKQCDLRQADSRRGARSERWYADAHLIHGLWCASERLYHGGIARGIARHGERIQRLTINCLRPCMNHSLWLNVLGEWFTA